MGKNKGKTSDNSKAEPTPLRKSTRLRAQVLTALDQKTFGRALLLHQMRLWRQFAVEEKKYSLQKSSSGEGGGKSAESVTAWVHGMKDVAAQKGTSGPGLKGQADQVHGEFNAVAKAVKLILEQEEGRSVRDAIEILRKKGGSLAVSAPCCFRCSAAMSVFGLKGESFSPLKGEEEEDTEIVAAASKALAFGKSAAWNIPKFLEDDAFFMRGLCSNLAHDMLQQHGELINILKQDSPEARSCYRSQGMLELARGETEDILRDFTKFSEKRAKQFIIDGFASWLKQEKDVALNEGAIRAIQLAEHARQFPLVHLAMGRLLFEKMAQFCNETGKARDEAKQWIDFLINSCQFDITAAMPFEIEKKACGLTPLQYAENLKNGELIELLKDKESWLKEMYQSESHSWVKWFEEEEQKEGLEWLTDDKLIDALQGQIKIAKLEKTSHIIKPIVDITTPAAIQLLEGALRADMSDRAEHNDFQFGIVPVNVSDMHWAGLIIQYNHEDTAAPTIHLFDSKGFEGENAVIIAELITSVYPNATFKTITPTTSAVLQEDAQTCGSWVAVAAATIIQQITDDDTVTSTQIYDAIAKKQGDVEALHQHYFPPTHNEHIEEEEEQSEEDGKKKSTSSRSSSHAMILRRAPKSQDTSEKKQAPKAKEKEAVQDSEQSSEEEPSEEFENKGPK